MEQPFIRVMDRWDEAEFRQMVDQYSQDIWNYAYFMTKSRDSADDVAQEVFIKAYFHIAQFRGHSSMKTWLISIARHLVLNYLRSSFVRKVTLVDFIMQNEASRSAEQEVLDQLASKEIWRIVLALPSKHREVLLLDIHYGLSIKEMAELLGIAEGTVKSRLSRARGKVTKQLRKEEPSYETI